MDISHCEACLQGIMVFVFISLDWIQLPMIPLQARLRGELPIVIRSHKLSELHLMRLKVVVL